MADISKIKVLDGTTYDIKDATARATGKVSGVKGNAESSYRTGNVNLTSDNIGAIPANLNGNTQKLARPIQLNGCNDNTLDAKINTLRANRLAFLPADQIIIEQTVDGGATWTDAGYADSTKTGLFSETRAGVAIPKINGEQNINCGLRITITAMKYNVPSGTAETQKYNYWNSNYIVSTERYNQLKEMYFWVSTSNNSMSIKIERATGANSTNWVNLYDSSANSFGLTGWSGNDYIKFTQGVFGGGTTQTGNYWNYRLTFFTRGSNGSTTLNTGYLTSSQSIMEIRGYGDTWWTAGNEYAANDKLYSHDYLKNATFPAKVTATSFAGPLTGNVTGNVSGTAANVTGVVAVANGGSGKTTAKDAANVFINGLDTGSSTPVDADYYISQFVGGGNTTTTYHRRPMSALWEYIKGKISSVLGLTASSYGGSAAKVNNHTVAIDVPANAVFTDTTYESKAAASGGTAVSLVTTGEKYTWNNKSSLALGTTSSTAYRGDYGAAAYAHGVTNKGSAFTSGMYKITTNSEGHVTAATAVAKSDITALGIPAQDTTYESKAAASGGTAVSLVTTGEKYTWNNKSNLALGTTSSTAYRGDYGNAAYAHGVTNKGSAFASGLYKITTNSEGHVTAATAVAKGDITALGIPAQDTTYESKTAVNGGTALSLVTTGEKYTWNSKGTYSKPSGGIPASDLASNVISRIFPAGGSSGQFLAKNSVTDYDLGWADQTTYVTASVSGALHTIDKTYDELKTLINKGNHVILTYYGDPYQLDSIKTSGTIKFARSTVNEGDNTVSKVTFEITKSGTNTNVSRVVDTIYVPRVFVGATVFDVYNDGEGGYTVSCTGAEDMGDIFLAGTTHSLSLTYHKVEMGEPGVDGNLEQYELVSSYTTNEYSSEIGDYMYTGHLVFNSVDTTSSKIKTFVISSVLYMDPYFESATITYSESPLGGGGIVSQNVQVAANAWASDNTYANYPYKATITISGVTSSMIPEVVFGPDDAASGNYAAVASTGTNAVYIYAKQAGAVAITIPTIIVR